MPFKTYIPFHQDDGPVNIRAYVHDCSSTFLAPNVAHRHLCEIVDTYRYAAKQYDFIIAALWENEGAKMVDMVGFWDRKNNAWPGNPTSATWMTENGVYVFRSGSSPEANRFGCKDTYIMLGREMELMGLRLSLEQYLASENPLGLPLLK